MKYVAGIPRAAIGFAASILVLVLAFGIPWTVEGALVSEIHVYTELALTGAAFLLAATLVGSYIARISFALPGVVLAISTWALTESFFKPWVKFMPCGNSMHYDGVNFVILLVAISGATAGAILGRQLSKWNKDNVANAA